MRVAKWIVLVALVGVFTGMLWAGYHVVNAPTNGDEDTTPPSDEPTDPDHPTVPDSLELYRLFLRNTEDVDQLKALLDEDGGIVYHAHLALARLYRENGELAKAIDHFEDALALYRSSDALREYAETLEEEGHHEEACALWQRLLPHSAAADAVQRLCPPLTAAVFLNRAGLHVDALAVLAEEATPAVEWERARARVGLGEHKAALDHFRSFLEHDPENLEARLQYASALDRAGSTERALAEYQRVGPGGMRARGRLLERLGRADEALEAYAQSSDPEGLWRAAQMLEERDERTRANRIYKDLVASRSRVADDAALRLYLYYQRQGEADAAGVYLDELSLALAYLADAFDGTWRVVDDPVMAETPPALTRADALLESFNMEWSLIELDVLLKEATSAERIAVGQWLLENKLYHRAVRLGMGMFSEIPSLSVYQLAYPLAYKDLVLAASNEFEVDPFLIWAVMREESHFRPDALSWADARGLMQVIPSTGEWIAERLKEEYRGQALYEPEVSIRYGAWYLAHLVELFDGELSQVVAAYNGGPGSVNRWLRSPVYQEPVDLPGVTTFQETREYIDKVLSSWLIYHWLYSDES